MKACDIIIPVFNAPDDLRACVDSVLADTDGDYRLVLIDDCSTDPAVEKYLKALEARKIANLEIEYNALNSGFVKTANRGMREGVSDVVLLNSDTVVTRGWLGKMVKCAYSDESIASVTPLTNNGTICSVPKFYEDNPLPEGMSVAGMGELVERVSRRSYPRIPTAVGFCMYMKRAALEKVGYFDEETYGRGYGEENDWCCRAMELGYTHALDDATFIYHKGAMSFKGDSAALQERNTGLLLERYPYYNDMVGRFITENPLREIQENIRLHLDIARQQRRGPLRILHVVHGFPPVNRAGTETYTYYLAMAQASMGNDVSVFCWVVDGTKTRYSVMDEEQQGVRIRRVVNNFDNACEPLGFYPDENIERAFASYLDEVRPYVVHFQHLMGLSSSLPYVAREHGCSTVMTLHDFWPVCTRIQLVDAREELCGGPEDGYRCARVCPQEVPAVSPREEERYQETPAAPAQGETRGFAMWRKIKSATPHPVKWFIKYKVLGADPGPAGQAGGRDEQAAVPERIDDREAAKYRDRLSYNRTMLSAMDLLIAPSEFIRDKYIEFGIEGQKIMRVYHGVAKHGLTRIEKTPSGVLRIGYLGTLVRHKGIDVLIKAFNALPPGRAELYLHGYGDENEGDLVKEWKGLAKAEGVHFMGPYKHGELGGILSRLDVVVVPSTCYESFNLVVREAFLSGTPVVASRVGALTEAVAEGRNGFLFKAGDPSSLAGRLLTLIEEPEMLKVLTEGASKTPVKGMEEHAVEIIDIYGDVMAKHGRTPGLAIHGR
jgi:glycosyltransferase involved in cell wall biosynthesis/GT2 family glycosyltransferase